MSEEFSENFGSPIPESLAFFFVLFSFIGFTASSSMSIRLVLPGVPSSVLSLPLSLWMISDFMMMIIQIMLSIVVSAMIARSIAGAFESGLIRTFLSYPISRSGLILAKLVTNISIVGGIMTAAVLALIPLSGLFLLPLSHLLGLIVSIWITILMVSTSATLASLVLKSESKASLPLLFTWFTLILLGSFIPNPVVRAIIRPNLALAYGWLPEVVMSKVETVEALLGSTAVIAVMLVASVVYSSRLMEC